jgi:hypothetical protein
MDIYEALSAVLEAAVERAEGIEELTEEAPTDLDEAIAAVRAHLRDMREN